MAERWLWPGSELVRAIDGDTIICRLTRDLGFHGRAVFTQRLRLEGLNTPPRASADGQRALAHTAARLGALAFHVETTGPYKYGDEWMALVTLADGTLLNDELVRIGLAVAWDGRGARPGG